MNIANHTPTVEEVVELILLKLKNNHLQTENQELTQKWNLIKESDLFHIAEKESVIASKLTEAYFFVQKPKTTTFNGQTIVMGILEVLQNQSSKSEELISFNNWLVNYQNSEILKNILINTLQEPESQPTQEPTIEIMLEPQNQSNSEVNLESKLKITNGLVNGLPFELELEKTNDLQKETLSNPNNVLPVESLTEQPTRQPIIDVEFPDEPEPVLIKPIWNDLPIEDAPDKHDEFFHSFLVEEGIQFIAARARGKKHKHEGTNCDDWFEFTTSGKWQLIAVSDGAGSKRFSRVGAQVGCEAAIKHLSNSLKNHTIEERETWTNEDLVRNPATGKFEKEDIEYVQSAIHDAMRYARDEIEYAALKRSMGKDKENYQQILGRDIQFNDLSATLLIAVHCLIPYKGQLYSFVLTSQIGDGMLAAIHQNNALELLGIPDSGEFSGETDFITSIKTIGKQYLTGKTRGTFGRIKLLMVMTDGISDDYYPNNPGLIDLYNDLISQNVLTNQHPIEKLKANDKIIFSTPEEMKELPSEKLLHMIDTYQLRGSFDDRTIVLLNKGE